MHLLFLLVDETGVKIIYVSIYNFELVFAGREHFFNDNFYRSSRLSNCFLSCIYKTVLMFEKFTKQYIISN